MTELQEKSDEVPLDEVLELLTNNPGIQEVIITTYDQAPPTFHVQLEATAEGSSSLVHTNEQVVLNEDDSSSLVHTTEQVVLYESQEPLPEPDPLNGVHDAAVIDISDEELASVLLAGAAACGIEIIPVSDSKLQEESQFVALPCSPTTCEFETTAQLGHFEPTSSSEPVLKPTASKICQDAALKKLGSKSSKELDHGQKLYKHAYAAKKNVEEIRRKKKRRTLIDSGVSKRIKTSRKAREGCIVEKVIGRCTKSGREYVLVEWKDGSSPTFERYEEICKKFPAAVISYYEELAFHDCPKKFCK